MIIQTEKKQIKLGYAAEDGVITGAEYVSEQVDFVPGDSGVFSAEMMQRALALATSSADEALLRENLGQLGYKGIGVISFDNNTEDRIGMCIGAKQEDDLTRVAVILRGTQGREWYSNFDVGYGSEHRGFSKAADYAEQRLCDYLFTHILTSNLSFNITGYSRGGAVANILSKRLCDRYGVDRVRCYTFASPNTCISPRGARYLSIFNLVRDEDFFTRVPLSGWGYHKYGMTLSLSDTGDISERFEQLSAKSYIGYASADEVNEVLGALMRLSPTTHAYYERRYPVAGRMMSLHDYMLSVADMLSGNLDENTGDVMMSGMVSEFADLASFLSNGMDIADLLAPAAGIPRCSVADSHTAAAYIAAAQMYPVE